MQLTLAGFTGANQAVHPKLLPDNLGVQSLNQKPGRGDLRPWRAPAAVATVGATRQTIYRMGRDVASDANYWLSWTGVVHAMRGFITEDTTERTFYTGDGPPKQTDNTIALAGTPYPNAWRYLGVPRPADTPTVTVLDAGTATDTEIRYLVYTYVTTRGEESAPSPVSLPYSGKTDATWTIDNLGAPPTGPYDINRIRVYRTQTGQAGDTEFFFLREILSTSTTTTDDGRALGEVLPTDGWLVPDADMSWLTPMWNGMAAGIVKGAVRYCVAYKPYAWPVAYETLPPDAQAVALGRFGQALLVLTTARPVLVSGSSPDALTEEPLEFAEACIAPRSVASLGHGVAWACPDGLAYFGSSGPKICTAGIFTRDDWQAIDPKTLVGGSYEGFYIGFYGAPGARKGFAIDPVDPTGVYWLDKGYDALYFDELQDALYVLDGTSVKKWDSGDLLTATFRSKVWRTYETSFAGARVLADAFPVTVRWEAQSLDPAVVSARVAARPDIYSAPTSTTLRFTKTVTSRKPFRLPGDILATDWQLEVASTNPVQSVVVATSYGELGNA
ncbi:hypothetical protein H4CHR_04377 [Variovorax sp. PBS-H4]|uniref:hypothetical protein n=1 Tax=Variovorax sp. PBS-H4 TaxID=434008 RepID=UPI001316964B|nr:hypothetical protein [Variovorax sp. PBS-H4]VTU38251.1 hypothetical protein H4CHR_04377 [Variovorax sp. PBS-H4]